MKTILIIDDEHNLVELIKVNLVSENFQVFDAGNGEDGLAKASSSVPDLVILDVVLPGISGWQVCRRLKSDSMTKHIPVLFLSAATGKDNASRAEICGADGFLTKPFDTAEFIQTVRECINDGSVQYDEQYSDN